MSREKINKTIESIWDEFIYGGHLIAIGLTCFSVLPALLLNIQISFDFLIVVYLLALGPCLFGRYIDLKEDALTNPERSDYLSKKAKYIPFMITFCVITVLAILVYNNKPALILFGVGMIILSFMYDLFLKSLTKIIIGFKNIFVGVLFSLLPVMMALYYNVKFDFSFFIIVLYIFMMTLIGSAFSDIKDIEGDKKDGLKTFAIVLGHKNLIKFLAFLTVLAMVPIIVGVYFNLLPVYSLAVLLSGLFNAYLFKESFNKNITNKTLYAVLCDSQLSLWLVFPLAGKVLTSWIF